MGAAEAPAIAATPIAKLVRIANKTVRIAYSLVCAQSSPIVNHHIVAWKKVKKSVFVPLPAPSI
jgi:hypothetical protein